MSDPPPKPDRLNIRIGRTIVRVVQDTGGFFLELGNVSVGLDRQDVRDLIGALTKVDNLMKSEEDGSCSLAHCTNPRQGFSALCEHHNTHK